MTIKEIDYKLLEKAKKDKVLIHSLSVQFGKHHYDVFKWLDNDYENLPPEAYEKIKKHFKSK